MTKREKRGCWIWMAVTPDDLQLPIAVALSAVELAELVGVKPETIRSEVSRFRGGKTHGIRHRRYYKIYLDEIIEEE